MTKQNGKVTKKVTKRQPCYCIQLFKDHLVGDKGCAFNADWTSR